MMNLKEGMRRVGIVLGLLGCVAGGTFGYLRLQTLWRNHTRFTRLCSLPIMEQVNTAMKEYRAAPKTLPANFFDSKPEHGPKFNPNAPYTVVPSSDSQMPTGGQGKPEHGPWEKYRAREQSSPARASEKGDPFKEFGGHALSLDSKQKEPEHGPSDKYRAKDQLPNGSVPDSGDNTGKIDLSSGLVPFVKVKKSNWFDKHAPGLAESNIEYTIDTGGTDGIQTVDADKNGVIVAIQLSSGEWVQKEPQNLKAHLAFFGRLLLLLLYPLIGFFVPWGAIRTIAWVVSGFSTPTTTP